jgi:hypothetical protein
MYIPVEGIQAAAQMLAVHDESIDSSHFSLFRFVT